MMRMSQWIQILVELENSLLSEGSCDHLCLSGYESKRALKFDFYHEQSGNLEL
jgi:hypothetical protein